MNAPKRLFAGLRVGARRGWRQLVLFAALLVFAGLRLASGGTPPPPAPPAATPPLASTPPRTPPKAWLGLNYNSAASVGSLRDFAARGIVYDREGTIEVIAGQTPENTLSFSVGLATSFGAGMVPDVEIDLSTGPPGCSSNPSPRKFCLPTGQSGINAYVAGFVQTVRSVLDAYPNRHVLFEPLDEPWDWASPPGTQSGKSAAVQYAAILAGLLPASVAANIPLNEIYIPATGALGDGSSWIPDLYQARPCLKSGPGTCGPIAGWNVHPYGLPHSAAEGIESVPRMRASMLSGQDNIVVSEIGFCATDVDGGAACNKNLPDIDGPSADVAMWLTETLEEAAQMHAAGWLKALLIWERAGSGWAMQNPDGSLTAQGRALDLFANSAAGR